MCVILANPNQKQGESPQPARKGTLSTQRNPQQGESSQPAYKGIAPPEVRVGSCAATPAVGSHPGVSANKLCLAGSVEWGESMG